MRELSEFLTENELYVYFNHPAKTYRVLADELGLSYSRVSKIKYDAKKKIIKEKHMEQMAIRAQKSVDITLKHKEIYVLCRALRAYSAELTDADMRKKQPIENDPDYEISEKLIKYFSDILSEKV